MDSGDWGGPPASFLACVTWDTGIFRLCKCRSVANGLWVIYKSLCLHEASVCSSVKLETHLTSCQEDSLTYAIYRPHLGRHWCHVKGHPHKQRDVWLGPNALQEPSGQHTAKWGEEGGRIVPKACRGWGPPLPSPQQHSLGSRQTQELQLLSWTILAPWISNPLGQTQRHKPRKKRNLGVSRSGRMSLDKNSIFKI